MAESGSYLPVFVRSCNSSDRDLRRQLSWQDDEVTFLNRHCESPELTGEVTHCTGLRGGEGLRHDLVDALIVFCGGKGGHFLETYDCDVVFQGTVLVFATLTSSSQINLRFLFHTILP